MNRRSRIIAAVALSALVALLLAYAATGFVVRRHVLASDTYTGALAEVDAFDRVYTEVLVDPAFEQTVADLLGQIRVDPALAPDVRTTTANALRWALPPNRLRTASDQVIADVIAYVRGDEADFRPTVKLDRMLDKVDDAAVILTSNLLARASVVEVGSTEEYQRAVDAFVADLRAGRVPASIPVLADTAFDPTEARDVILDAVGVDDDPAVREQVAASLAEGDQAAALVSATVDQIRPYVERRLEKVRDGDGSGEFDVVGAITDRARAKAGSAEVGLTSVREAVRWFAPGLLAFALIAAVASLGAVAFLNRGRWRRFAALVSAACATAAVTMLLLARFVGSRLTIPLDDASAASGGWNLPDGLRPLVGDLARILGRDLRGSVMAAVGALWLLAAAFAVAAFAVHLGRAVGVSDVSSVGTALRRRARAPQFVAVGVAALLVLGAGALTGTSVGTSGAPACNGRPELCNRAYDEVAYAATHNSMSSPNVVKVWPEHDGTMTEQLDAGVRALLIDTHYWRSIDGAAHLVRLLDERSVRMPESVAQAVVDSAGSLVRGRPGTFLCHNECVFGGEPFVDGLVEIRRFMEANPREVVTLIIQDDVTPADTVKAFHEAGLDDMVYGGTGPWPTLGQLIDSGRRLVVFAEFYGGAPKWYRHAWDAIQDTPYGFRSPDEMSCEPNRGEGDPSLFLINHWISRLTPSRADAAVVNQRDFLLDRARRCERERGMLPNFLAVDFYNIGDVVSVADELNGFP